MHIKVLQTSFLIIVIFVGFTIGEIANAGTLYCTLRTSSCGGGEVEVYRMSATTNAHAQLPGQPSPYSQIVCCGGVTGLGTTCGSGTYATALKLSGVSNAHVQQSGTYGSSACLSVPTGGTVSAGFAANCYSSGYDTSLGSMSAATNAHVATSTAAYTIKICATAAGAGSLSVDIVDGTGVSVASPSYVFGAMPFSFSFATTTATLGTSSQNIRVANTTANPNWSLTMAATSTLAHWYGGPTEYSFNTKGGGRLFADASAGTITPQNGCSSAGLSLGSLKGFNSGVTDSITLLTASSGATNCYWDLTNVTLSQRIPASQPIGSYRMSLVLTAS